MRKQLYICVVVALLIIAPRFAAAQQNPVYDQYMLNMYLINPAVAGYEGVTELYLYGREQWVGYRDRPRTYSLSFQTRIYQDWGFTGKRRAVRRGKHWGAFVENITRPSMGIGAILYNDINGRMRRTGLQGSYSYLFLGGPVMYSIGLSLSLQQYAANVLPEDLYNPMEPDPLVMAGQPNSGFAPDAGVGFLASNADFFAGFSVANLLQNALQFGKDNRLTAYRQLRQYHVMGGYRFTPGRDHFAMEPSAVVVLTERLGWMVDVNFKCYYRSNYWAGVSFRALSNLIVMGGLRYKRFLVGYSYEYALGSSHTATRFGSHEFMLGWRMGDLDNRGNVIRKF